VGKDKSPCPDGWTIEIFIDFLDLLGEDLLQVVKNVWVTSAMPDNMNENSISLIHKVDKYASLVGLQCISLCNCVYKVVAKILACRLKSILLNYIYEEQL